jgi:hypothetical protein
MATLKEKLFTKSYFGIGYFGEGPHIARSIQYNAWKNIFDRCYLETSLAKQPTYLKCTVDKRWHNFQDFGDWFVENYIDGWQLDKDILKPGNTVYGPDTCCFIPQEINKCFNQQKAVKSPYKLGVSKMLDGRSRPFSATINLGGKVKRIVKYFGTEDEASDYYNQEKEKYVNGLAEIHKDKLNSKAYQALLTFKINQDGKSVLPTLS